MSTPPVNDVSAVDDDIGRGEPLGENCHSDTGDFAPFTHFNLVLRRN
jgi:hypothetical protein